MYSKEQLKVLDKIPKVQEISLKIIQEFYSEYLTNRIYTYRLRPHKSKEEFEIQVRFFTENLPHLLGIQKVVPSSSNTYLYQGKDGYEGILNGSITIEKLINIDEQRPRSERVFPQIESRITGFYLVPKLMEECEMVKFSALRVRGNCNIKSDFMLYKRELGVKLHLGVIQEKGKTIYVPETFMVKSERARDVDRLTEGQQYMNIVSRSIRIVPAEGMEVAQ